MLRDIANAYKLPEPLRLSGDFLVAGDIHCPLWSYTWVERILTTAKRKLKKPRRLIIGGDFFNLDAFSQYAQVIPPVSWQQERDAARAAIKAFLDVFDDVNIIMGNHERRLQKFTAGAFEESDLLALITTNERVTMSPLGYCFVESGGYPWLVAHPKNYSINRLMVADALAEKYRRHVIGLHEHHLAIGWSRYNHYCIVNGGCIVDPDKLAYVSLDPSKSATMQNGFVILKNGAPTLYGEAPFTDWS